MGMTRLPQTRDAPVELRPSSSDRSTGATLRGRSPWVVAPRVPPQTHPEPTLRRRLLDLRGDLVESPSSAIDSRLICELRCDRS